MNTPIPFDELFEEENKLQNPETPSSYDLVDEEDKWILMQRDAHFFGSFEWMLEYYLNESVGVDPMISVNRIQELYSIEKQNKSNLAPVLLDSRDAERISLSRDAYKNLKNICENSKKSSPALLLADLILSESHDAEEEIKALADLGTEVVPILIQALNSETFLDLLGPGYGLAPLRILKVLSAIKDPSVVSDLFAILNRDLLEDEEPIIDCMRSIGDKAITFLSQVLNSTPFNKDNSKAAFALISFQSALSAHVCLKFLERNLENLENFKSLASYCLLGCEMLDTKDSQKSFIALSAKLPDHLKGDYQLIANSFA